MNEENITDSTEDNVIQNLMKKVSLSVTKFDINASNEEGKTLLHAACQAGMEHVVEILLQYGSKINSMDYFGRTPIMLACFAGYENIVDILITHNADINCEDFYGFNALTLGAYGGCNMVKYLLNKHITNESNANYLGYIPLLPVACSTGNEELVNFMLSHDPGQINMAIEKSGMTSLMIAICSGYVKLAKQLINYGASYSMKSKASFSSICYALKFSFPLLELKIPSLTIDHKPNQLIPDQLIKHPLTPNLYLSPKKNVSSPKKCLHWFKKSARAKRSRSLDNKKNHLTNSNGDSNDKNILKSIFQIANLQRYWPTFKEQQISFKTFLTMDEEDLRSIGINNISVLNKLLTLIDHYNHIFYL